MKSTFTTLVIAFIAILGINAQTVNLSTKALFYGESVTVNWSGFSGPVNVILKNGSEFIAYASANVAGSGQQSLRMTNQDIGTGYQLKVGTDYHVLVELRSNTNIKKESERFSVSFPEVTVQPLSLNYGEKATLRWKGFASNVNLIFIDNGQEIVYAAANVPGNGEQSITLTDEAVNKSGYQITTGYNYSIKVQLRSEPSKTFSSNAFSIQRTFNFNISPVGNLSVNETAGDGQVLIYCNAVWTAYYDQNWIRITSSKTGTGNGVLTYQYDENPNQSPRSAVITVTSGTTSRYLTVGQSGKIITIKVIPSIVKCESAGGSFSVDVQANTSWTASCSSNWLIIQSGNNGWNNGTVHFNVHENSSPDSRNTTIEVVAANFSKQIISVYQNGVVAIEKAVSFDIEKEGISSILWPYAQGSFQSPENWRITQDEGAPGSWHHSGDYYAQDWGNGKKPDSTFYSPFSGLILYAGNKEPGSKTGYGNQIVIQSLENPDFAFRVAHLHEISVSKGQIVKVSHRLGKVGSTGNSTGFHAHCVLYKNISGVYSGSISCIDRLKDGLSLGADTESPANNFASEFVFDATYESAIGGGGEQVLSSMFGFDKLGRFFLDRSVVASFNNEKISVGFWNYNQNRYEESEMILNGGYYEFPSGDKFDSERQFVFILYTSEGKKFLPHLIFDLIDNKNEVVSNGAGGYNFRKMPSDTTYNPTLISPNMYGFTGEGQFFIHKSIIPVLGLNAIKIGYWNYSFKTWEEKTMTLSGDFYKYNSQDKYWDFRDYIFIVESSDGKSWLPETIKERLGKDCIRSNGYGGWNFYTKPSNFEDIENKPIQFGPESYGFTVNGEFFMSKVLLGNTLSSLVQVGYWSYKENTWKVQTMQLDGSFYFLNSEDPCNSYRDYIFVISSADGMFYIPEKIMSGLIQKEDIESNGNGGFNFRTLPKEKPADTKSAMITSISTISRLKNKDPELKIYPNPAHDKLYIESNEIKFSAYEITDIMGKVINKNGLNGNVISLDGLSSGIYILRINNSNGEIINSKFIKE